MSKKPGLFAFLLFFTWAAGAQTSDSSVVQPHWLSKKTNFQLQASMAMQWWVIYSTDFEIFNPSTGKYEPVDDRFNASVRRGRLSFKAEPYPRLLVNTSFIFDQIGRDLLTSSTGSTNKSDPIFSVVDAYLQWQALQGRQYLFVVAGWHRPQMQRESITSAFAVGSFEKSASQTYLRRHLVGAGLGRAPGITVGGLTQGAMWGLQYNVGVFNPITIAYSGTSLGNTFNPVYSCRLVTSIGQPEFTNYSINYTLNKFGQRRGLSLDFNAAFQGATDLFDQSSAIGPGMLFNWGPWTFDGEWMWMSRSGTRRLENDALRDFDTHLGTGHARLGYTFLLHRYALEPVAMVMQFSGPLDAVGQADAKAAGDPAGRETAYDIGINWFLNANQLRLMLHYTFRNGDPGVAGDGATVNDYFTQSGIGAIRRGNWWGLGLNASF